MTYIWQREHWPNMTWDSDVLMPLLGQARFVQGVFLGRVQRVGFDLGEDARVDILTEETLKTSAIEGEHLNKQEVRSSVSRHLGLSEFGLGSASQSVDGLVDVLWDATTHYSAALTSETLKNWHASLFPTGYTGFHRLKVGQWRGDDPMRIVSGAVGREKIHFEAPPGATVQREMDGFFEWWETSFQDLDGLLRAGLAHFYFVVIHPFEDGNGRIARALTDRALAQDEKSGNRYYSMSSQIMEERAAYYHVLEASSRSDTLDVTGWLSWFLGCYQRAIGRSDEMIRHVGLKADFWQKNAQVSMNERQQKVVNRLLDVGPGNFEGGLTTRKYLGMVKVSRATAFREISDLLEKGILVQNTSKGRSVNYDINWGLPL